ncbi:MAG TPA: hypothetical protein VF094_11750 [Gaiellaceae bacterium]
MTLASVLAIAAFALVAAGCGGSGSARVASVASSTTTRGSSSTNSSAQSALARFQTPLAYARCIRAHGVPNFPDPDSKGAFDKQALRSPTANPRYQTASETCHRRGSVLGPGVQPSHLGVRQMMNDLLSFARCVRSHGVPNWPDPSANAEGPDSPGFGNTPGVDTQAPQVLDAIGTCQHLVPGYANAPRGTYP